MTQSHVDGVGPLPEGMCLQEWDTKFHVKEYRLTCFEGMVPIRQVANGFSDGFYVGQSSFALLSLAAAVEVAIMELKAKQVEAELKPRDG